MFLFVLCLKIDFCFILAREIGQKQDSEHCTKTIEKLVFEPLWNFTDNKSNFFKTLLLMKIKKHFNELF